jgi:hypothetical protein
MPVSDLFIDALKKTSMKAQVKSEDQSRAQLEKKELP